MFHHNRSNKIQTISRVILLVVFAMSSVTTFAWGDKGHRIVARIAWANLTPAARTKIASLLTNDSFLDVCRDDQHLPVANNADQFVCIATWADKVRNERKNTTHWHFVDIPRDAQTYLASRDCKEDAQFGDCVIQEVERAFADLSNQQTNATDRAEALKFLVHFIGDMHQPLHDATDTRDQEAIANGEKTDRGANLKFVTWLGKETNPFNDNWELHAVWDTGIIQEVDPQEVHFANALLQALTAAEKASSNVSPASVHWASTLHPTLVKWAEDSHAIAVNQAYKTGPQDMNSIATDSKSHKRYHRFHLDNQYLNANAPVVKKQLRLAGVRLAKVLNEALR